VFEEEDAAAALAGFDGAHESGCAGAYHYCVEVLVGGGLGHRRPSTLAFIRASRFQENLVFRR
jgi:hypothetical protein